MFYKFFPENPDYWRYRYTSGSTIHEPDFAATTDSFLDCTCGGCDGHGGCDEYGVLTNTSHGRGCGGIHYASADVLFEMLPLYEAVCQDVFIVRVFPVSGAKTVSAGGHFKTDTLVLGEEVDTIQ